MPTLLLCDNGLTKDFKYATTHLTPWLLSSSHIAIGTRKLLCQYLKGAEAKWSKALLERENKRKSRESRFTPPAWAIVKERPIFVLIIAAAADKMRHG